MSLSGMADRDASLLIERQMRRLRRRYLGFVEKKHNFLLCVNQDDLMKRARQGWLVSGFISDEQFWLLVKASSIRSDKVVNALFDYLVNGISRKESCAKYDVNSGHFSIGLGRLQQLSHTAAELSRFYRL